jgi:monoamine oxidase
MRSRNEEADVLILGAGIAGLAAAERLAAAGLEIRVIEARDRIGGRIWTLRDATSHTPIELGAEFIHGGADATERVAADARLALLELKGGHWTLGARGVSRAEQFQERIGAAIKRVSRHVAPGHDRSFLDALEASSVPEPSRTYALAFVEGFQAADAAHISARALGGDDVVGRLRRVLSGYDALAVWLGGRLPNRALCTGTIANRVRWKRGNVLAESKTMIGGEGPTFRGRALVSTIPVSLVHEVRFEPEVRGLYENAGDIAMGHVEKIVLRFAEAFWHKARFVRSPKGQAVEELAFVHAPEQPFPAWWTTYPIISPFVTGWAGGPKADAIGLCDDRTRLAVATASFAAAIGIDPSFVERQLSEWWRHDWRRDPFSRGAYTYPIVGAVHAARALRRPVDGTLFFAGEATCDPPENGTVNGAIESGVRAADEVLSAFGMAPARGSHARRARALRGRVLPNATS